MRQPTATGRMLTDDQAERKAVVPAVKVDWEKGARAAMEKVSGGKLVDIELTRSAGGGPEWDAEVAAADGTAHDVRVDAVTGKVTRSRVKSDQDTDDKAKVADRLKKAKISPQQAATAGTDRKKGTVTAVELDSERGATVWSVDVVTTDDWYKTTFDVDAANGKVLRQKVDRD
ncbi:PepSY domain-containing protein [Streptomyces sp. NPDC001339]|uniref:PepSY domain-containing protein n=1 Tax=Streptomyces sp. NPDC001339 TaxID=3364563 RepID=UPI0036B67879